MQVEGWPAQDDPAGHVRGPELKPMEDSVSVDVCTLKPSGALAPLFPIVNPLIVIVKLDDALIDEPDVVIITEVLEVKLHAATRLEILLAPAATVGVTDGAKKLEGTKREMVPPEGMAVFGVNTKVMGTLDLPTTRSRCAIVKENDETLELTPPEFTAFDIEHMFVRNLTPTEPVVDGPIVKPVMVTVNAD